MWPCPVVVRQLFPSGLAPQSDWLVSDILSSIIAPFGISWRRAAAFGFVFVSTPSSILGCVVFHLQPNSCACRWSSHSRACNRSCPYSKRPAPSRRLGVTVETSKKLRCFSSYHSSLAETCLTMVASRGYDLETAPENTLRSQVYQ